MAVLVVKYKCFRSRFYYKYFTGSFKLYKYDYLKGTLQETYMQNDFCLNIINFQLPFIAYDHGIF